jgi:macrophage colony-stimulating factor 1 receptor
MAPECIGQKKYSEATDVWAFASTLYEIVAKHEPFSGEDLMDVAVKVRDTGANPGLPEATPHWMRGIMQSCWQVDPTERPTFKIICELLLAAKPAGISLPSAPYTANGTRTTSGGYDDFGPSAGKVDQGKKKKSKSKAAVYDDINIEMEQV